MQEAERLINGDRQSTYGDPSASFNRIADLWTAYLNTSVTPLDVANLMVLLKVSRTKGTFHRDSYVDIGGYAGLAEIINASQLGATASAEPATVGPRVWESIASAPAEAGKLIDRDGDTYTYRNGSWYYDKHEERINLTDADDVEAWNSYAPFTEVPAPKPRVWASLSEIPSGVQVVASDGDTLNVLPGGNAWWGSSVPEGEDGWRWGPGDDSRYAPFTEVLS